MEGNKRLAISLFEQKKKEERRGVALGEQHVHDQRGEREAIVSPAAARYGWEEKEGGGKKKELGHPAVCRSFCDVR